MREQRPDLLEYPDRSSIVAAVRRWWCDFQLVLCWESADLRVSLLFRMAFAGSFVVS